MKKFSKHLTAPVGAFLSAKALATVEKEGRLLRLPIGVALLLWAITTTWSPILIFFSGFAFFEAIFSWCGFYAALGKNTCPVN